MQLYVKDVIVKLTSNKLGDHPLSYGEFLRWIGLWMLMATTSGSQRKSYWSMKPIDVFEGAPYRYNHWMSRDRFDDILCALTLTDELKPAQVDRFWEIRRLVKEWNKNMGAQFAPSWVVCLHARYRVF